MHPFHFKSYQIPDYTAYDQVLSAFKRLVPVPTVYVFRTTIISFFVFVLTSGVDDDRLEPEVIDISPVIFPQ